MKLIKYFLQFIIIIFFFIIFKILGYKKSSDLGAYIFSKLGMIPIEYNKDNSYNKKSVEKVYSSVYENLEKKNTILLFPEGQLNDNPKIMNKIKSGAFNFSKKTNTPIKIVALKGIEKIWPKHKFPTGYGTISVKLFDNEYSFDNIEDYKKTVRYQIENFIKNKFFFFIYYYITNVIICK